MALLIFAAAFAACEKTVTEAVLPEMEKDVFTFTAVAGTDTRVSAEFGDTQNDINFKWSEDDSLFVCFVEKDSLATMTDEKAKALPTYIFKLKSGAGSSRAVFQSTDMIPSEVLVQGTTYLMYAVHQAYFNTSGDWVNHWLIRGNRIVKYLGVPRSVVHYPSDPLRSIGDYDSLVADPAEITIASSPVLCFQHIICVYRMRVKNVGIEPVVVQSIEYPASDRFRPLGETRDYAETRGFLSCDTPVTISPGEQYCFSVAYQEQYADGEGEDCNHIITLSDGSRITIWKSPTDNRSFFLFKAGHMYSTTLAVKREMAVDSETLPPITGSDEDDF